MQPIDSIIAGSQQSPPMTQSRATFFLDDATMDGIRLLATRWNTSQAGVVQGAVAEAMREVQTLPTVQQALQHYRDDEVVRDAQDVQSRAAALQRQRMQEAAVRYQRLPTAK